MKPSDIAPRRMHQQHLWGTPLGSIEDVIGWLGAVQAQEFAVAKWSVAQRAKGVDNAAVDRAFAEGVILRTHVLRPTWHFVLPTDIRWMLALTAPRVHRMMSSYDRQLELDAKTYVKTDRLLAKAVAGRHLTRRELGDVLERAKIPARGQRLGHIVMHAELEGILCSGATNAKWHTYALIDERAPQAKTLDRDDALAELTRRYFTSHGPATVKDFVWWSSLTTADVRRGLEAAAKSLEHEVVDGRTYWFASAPAKRSPSGRFDLIQVYDENLIAYTESRDVLTGGVTIPPVGVALWHAVLAGGRLRGLWRPRPGQIETTFTRRLGAPEEVALDAATKRYSRFLGTRVPRAETPRRRNRRP
jgi:predicted transcriptional regulator